MGGTAAGAAKTVQKNLARDPDFYKKIGACGGRNGNTGGFADTRVGADGLTGSQRASIAGKKGGMISRKPVLKIESIVIDKVVTGNIKADIIKAMPESIIAEAAQVRVKYSLFDRIHRVFHKEAK